MESARAVLNDTVQNLEEKSITDWNKIKSDIRDNLSDFVWHETGRRPMIIPIIMEV